MNGMDLIREALAEGQTVTGKCKYKHGELNYVTCYLDTFVEVFVPLDAFMAIPGYAIDSVIKDDGWFYVTKRPHKTTVREIDDTVNDLSVKMDRGFESNSKSHDRFDEVNRELLGRVSDLESRIQGFMVWSVVYVITLAAVAGMLFKLVG